MALLAEPSGYLSYLGRWEPLEMVQRYTSQSRLKTAGGATKHRCQNHVVRIRRYWVAPAAYVRLPDRRSPDESGHRCQGPKSFGSQAESDRETAKEPGYRGKLKKTDIKATKPVPAGITAPADITFTDG